MVLAGGDSLWHLEYWLAEVRRLLLELQDVLYKLQSKRGQGWEGKFLQVPKCMMGEACAVKRGARIGKLCDCPQRSTCSYFFLRCL
ncbi:hypothetical protein GDO81_025832 [Engystomops pustulosus]|uniref:Cocaine- and amphetamine-regulated transcript protein n=1 Tax=Engystomops pustulosus TaxID=76066 RepID=A0AAV6Z037_ENGPU|nr:hypothetical protein GDO81_025832 [Engystomops pustulosus]